LVYNLAVGLPATGATANAYDGVRAPDARKRLAATLLMLA
jgi:hypothetical protein